MTKTVQLTLDETLLERIDRATRASGVPRADFIRHALELALQNQAVATLERQHRRGYQQHPVKPGEFDLWDAKFQTPELVRAWPQQVEGSSSHASA